MTVTKIEQMNKKENPEINIAFLHRFKSIAKKYGVAEDLIDWKSMDWSLTYPELKNILIGKLKLLGKTPIEEVTVAKDYVNYIEKETNQAERQYLKEQIAKDLEEIKKSTTPEMSKYYSVHNDYLDMLMKSNDFHSLILHGKAGLGKTFETYRYCGEKGIEFEVVGGTISPLELFHILYEYRNRENFALIFDDCKAILKNEQNASLMLQALWGMPKRICQWRTTSQKLKVPEIFEFKSKVVVIVNDIPKNIEPLLSRCLELGMSFDYTQIMKIMMEIAKIPHKTLSKEQRFEIVDWLRENSDETVENFNLRLQRKIEMIYQLKPDRWKDLSKLLITKDDNLALVKRIILESSCVKEQLKKFTEETGYGRYQFYKFKSDLGACRHYDK
jgi:hypothetical protein